MKMNKLLIGTMCALSGAIPFVAADLIRTGPEEYAVMVAGAVIAIGFIVGAVFLIRWIVRKIKNKDVTKDIKKDTINKK